MKKYILFLLFVTACKKNSKFLFTHILTNGGKKCWRYYYYNQKGHLINSNKGECICIDNSIEYYFYDWNDTDNKEKLRDYFDRKSIWRLASDSILLVDHAQYKIISYDSNEIILNSLHEKFIINGIFILRREKNQNTERKLYIDTSAAFPRL